MRRLQELSKLKGKSQSTICATKTVQGALMRGNCMLGSLERTRLHLIEGLEDLRDTFISKVCYRHGEQQAKGLPGESTIKTVFQQ